MKTVLFKCLIIALLISFHNTGYATPQLLLFTDKTESEIGRPIRVELYAIDIKNKLSKINLSPLSKDFGIVSEYSTDETSDSRWPGKVVQILNLKIYPRKTGLITIPSLVLNKSTSKTKTVTIKSSSSIADPVISLSTKSAYTRQQFIIQVSVVSGHLSSRLTINSGDKITGFESTALKFKRSKQKNGQYLLTTGWALSALNSGTKNIELPEIEYSESGVSRRKYYLPVQEMKIKSLPAYLPPTIPVGEVSLSSQLSKSALVKTDSVFYWKLKIQGKLSNSYQLPPVLRQVKSHNDLKIFPVNTEREQVISSDNFTSVVTHSIPVKINRSGFIPLPSIQAQYFEPDSGKIINISTKAQYVTVANSYLLILIYSLAALIFYFISSNIYKLFKIRNYKNAMRNNALNILKKELKPGDIRQAVNLLSRAEGWPENISLTQWKVFWSEKYNTDSEFSQLLQQLSGLMYAGKQSESIKELANKLIAIVENRQYKKRLRNFDMPVFNL